VRKNHQKAVVASCDFYLICPVVHDKGCPSMDKDTKKSLIQVANISSMGIALGVMIFGCFFIGLYIDRQLGTAYFFTFFFFLLGIIAGFNNIYRLIKKSLYDEKPVGEKDEPAGEKATSKKD
jgi:F0F1-type ATP synthase assembly protein I